MPNWCYTNYTIEGDEKGLKAFHKLIQSLQKRKKPFVPNGFGNLWLGCIVNKLGGDWNKVYCRGSVLDYQLLEDGTLYIMTETAWAEMREWRHFIESKYPSFKFYYQSEEEGCEYFVTNDSEGKHYPERFYLDDSENECMYFNTLQEAYEYVSKFTGKTVTNMDELNAALEEYQEAHEDVYLSFHEFEVIND